jgi:hypothetical protein
MPSFDNLPTSFSQVTAPLFLSISLAPLVTFQPSLRRLMTLDDVGGDARRFVVNVETLS